MGSQAPIVPQLTPSQAPDVFPFSTLQPTEAFSQPAVGPHLVPESSQDRLAELKLINRRGSGSASGSQAMASSRRAHSSSAGAALL